MPGLWENLLLGAKWAIFHGLCVGSYARYMDLRALAVRRAAAWGWYERAHVQFLKRFVRAGDTVVDVGANLGAYSLALAEAVGPRGKVMAFEPLEETFVRLRRAVAGLPQVSCFHLALSDRQSEAMEMRVPLLFGAIPEPSLAGLSLGGQAIQTEVREVRVAALDDYADQLDGVRFIKVDVEGHEPAFLRGAGRVLAKFRPLVQFEAAGLESSYTVFHEIAGPLGYSICALGDGGGLVELKSGKGAKPGNFYLRPRT